MCFATRRLILQTSWNKCFHSIPRPSLFSCDWFAHCSDSRDGDDNMSELWRVASVCLGQLISWHCLYEVSMICCISKHRAVFPPLLHGSSWTGDSNHGLFPCTQAWDNYYVSEIHRFWMCIRRPEKLVRKAQLVSFVSWLKSNFLY